MSKRIRELAEQAGADYSDFHSVSLLDKEIVVFAELIVAEAFRAGMLYSAKKYAEVADDRFTGNDVAMFLEMEACELSDEDIKRHFGVES